MYISFWHDGIFFRSLCAALEIYTLVNVFYPDSGRAAFYLAMAYDKNNDNARAIVTYQRMLGFWPDMSDAVQAIARLRAQTPGKPAAR